MLKAKPHLPCSYFLYIYNYYQQHLAKTVLLYMHFVAVARLCLISPHGLAAFLQVTLNFIDWLIAWLQEHSHKQEHKREHQQSAKWLGQRLAHVCTSLPSPGFHVYLIALQCVLFAMRQHFRSLIMKHYICY